VSSDVCSKIKKLEGEDQAQAVDTVWARWPETPLRSTSHPPGSSTVKS
jgi:hypothetical protein